MTIIAVTNNGAEAFSCKYDGILYGFPSGESTSVPMEAAQHIFGLGKSDKQEVMARHGWLTHSSGLAEGHAKLNSFAFGIHKDPEENIPALIMDELEQARQTPTDEGIEPEVEIEKTPDAEEVIHSADEEEHRSAPVLTESGEEASTDGLVESPVSAIEGADVPEIVGTIRLKKK